METWKDIALADQLALSKHHPHMVLKFHIKQNTKSQTLHVKYKNNVSLNSDINTTNNIYHLWIYYTNSTQNMVNFTVSDKQFLDALSM